MTPNSEENVRAAIAGWISVACWVVVFTPQIYKNYVTKSGEGLSLRFLIIWLIGDIFNIAGAAMEHLLATMLILGIYYTVTTAVLILQVLYYRHLERQQSLPEEFERLLNGGSIQARTVVDVEETPDNVEHNPWSEENVDNPRQLTSTTRRDDDGSSCFCIDAVKLLMTTLIMTCSVLLSIFCVLHLGLAQYLGWCSAALYVGSRLPQITKNRRNESTEGLALGMFMFGILGNATYCLSIFLQSTERDYLLHNLPWLVGSGGTLFLDIFIGIQFALYRRKLPVQPEVNTSSPLFREDIDDEQERNEDLGVTLA